MKECGVVIFLNFFIMRFEKEYFVVIAGRVDWYRSDIDFFRGNCMIWNYWEYERYMGFLNCVF